MKIFAYLFALLMLVGTPMTFDIYGTEVFEGGVRAAGTDIGKNVASATGRDVGVAESKAFDDWIKQAKDSRDAYRKLVKDSTQKHMDESANAVEKMVNEATKERGLSAKNIEELKNEILRREGQLYELAGDIKVLQETEILRSKVTPAGQKAFDAVFDTAAHNKRALKSKLKAFEKGQRDAKTALSSGKYARIRQWMRENPGKTKLIGGLIVGGILLAVLIGVGVGMASGGGKSKKSADTSDATPDGTTATDTTDTTATATTAPQPASQ